MDKPELLSKIIKLFRMTIVNMRMYPSGSDIVQKNFDELFESLDEYLAQSPMLSLMEMGGALLVDGHELTVPDVTIRNQMTDFARILRNQEIHSITLKKGMTRDNLNVFLDGITHKKPHLKTKDFLEKLFNEKKIDNIVIDQIDYIPVLKTETNVRKILELLNKDTEDMPDVMNTISQVYNILDEVQDKNTREQIQERIANYLSNKDVSLIKELLEKELPPKIEKSGLKDALLSTLTKERIEDIFRDVIKWCSEMKSSSSSASEFIKYLTSLKDFIKKFLASPASKLVSMEVYEELFRVGLLDQIPGWVEETRRKKQSLLLQIDSIIEGDSGSLLELGVVEHLPEVVEKLCQLGLDDTVTKLMEKMSENLQNPLVKIRRVASETMDKFIEVLGRYKKVNQLIGMANSFLTSSERENEKGIYSTQILAVSNIIEKLISYGCYSLVKGMLTSLKKLSMPDFFSDSSKTDQAQGAISSIFTNIKNLLLADFTSADPDKQDVARWFLLNASEDTVPSLITFIKETEDYRTRKLSAGILNSYGESCINGIKDNLNMGLTGQELRRLIEVLDEFPGGDFLNEIKRILPFGSPQAKISILDYLGKLNTAESRILIAGMLQHQEDFLKEGALDIIDKYGISEAVPEMKAAFPSAGPEIQKDIIAVLGKLKDPSAVPFLIKIVRSYPGLFGLIKGMPVDVRGMAARSLRGFLPDPSVEKALRELAKSGDLPIKTIAEEILNKGS